VPAPAEWELFDTHHDRIFRYVLGMVRDRAEAEDLTQETFLRAYQGGDALRDPNAARGWLYRIATNVCLDRLRQRRPHIPLDGQDAPSPALSVLEVTERSETSACVQRCLDFLSDRYRTVILLREIHSLTTAQIAELLGEQEGAVKIRLHRARRKLEQVMAAGCSVSCTTQGLPACSPKNPGQYPHSPFSPRETGD
jgi:RNA polymerase sigma-70 factor (ECF subfamily)